MFGIPYTEAVDMWSLGVVMGYIALGCSLFPGYCNYNTVSLKFTAPFWHYYFLKQHIWGAYPDVMLCFVSRYFVW